MLTTLLTVLFSGLVWQQTSLADESFGYVFLDGSSNFLICATNPLPGECSFQHEVAFGDAEMKRVQAAKIRNQKNELQKALGGAENSTTESCVATAHEYFCRMAFPLTCKEEYIVQDIVGVKKSCKTAERNCLNVTGVQSFIFQSLMNCSMSVEPVQPIKRQMFQCGYFPDVKDDPYTCAKRNYKVWSSNLTEQARTQVALHQMLVKNARNISQKCLDDVSEVICRTVAPACDRNETMIVSLLSKQECERITSCVNTTLKGKNLTEFQKMCTNLPDENTARKIQLSLVYTTFEDTIPNDTKKMNGTSTTTGRPVQSKATDSQSVNATGKSYSPKTEEPYQNTSMKPARILSKSTPMIQANLNKTNKNVKLTTEKPRLNATSKVKSASSLEPTTEIVLNYKLEDQLSTKLTKTPPPDVVGHVNATASRPAVTRPSFNESVNSQDQLSTKLTKTPQLNATALPCITGHVNATASRPVFTNVTAVFNMTVARPSFSVSVNCSNSTSPNCNKAQNTRINGLVVLAISILSTWMWQ